MTHEITRRRFIEHTAMIGGVATLSGIWAGELGTNASEPLKPIGKAQGIHPGRVVWVHDPQVTDWRGPQDGRWYEANHTKQDRVDAMMAQAVCDLTGEGTVSRAWDRLFLHFNRMQGRHELPYRPAEKIVIKPNWVGMIWREGSVDPETYTPIDDAPRRWNSPPFQGNWASSLLASQDPVAVDSVGLDFLRAEWDDYPHQPGADDYLHEAALAENPPSGTFYDPDHAKGEKRLSSLGVHEHWNNPQDKKYSRNLGTGEGIELVAAKIA